MDKDPACLLDDTDDEGDDPVPPNDPSYDQSGLKLLEVIGKGAYGIVYRAIWQGQLIAAKVIEHEGIKDIEGTLASGASIAGLGRDGTAGETTGDAPITNPLTEGALSLTMNHPNIVRTLCYEAVPKRVPTEGATHEIRLLMEFCDRGSLDKAVEQGCFHYMESNVLKVKTYSLLKTLQETAYAMRHLHNGHILHRDLKIQNILLKSSNKDSRGFTVKVSDFGLAKVWDGRGRSNSPSEKQKYAGTITHMAPELLEKGDVSTAADVYAFGILMWECYTQLTPYKGLGPPQVVLGVVSSHLRPAFASTAPKDYVDLARWCWAHNPAERPTFFQIARYLSLMLEKEENKQGKRAAASAAGGGAA